MFARISLVFQDLLNQRRLSRSADYKSLTQAAVLAPLATSDTFINWSLQLLVTKESTWPPPNAKPSAEGKRSGRVCWSKASKCPTRSLPRSPCKLYSIASEALVFLHGLPAWQILAAFVLLWNDCCLWTFVTSPPERPELSQNANVAGFEMTFAKMLLSTADGEYFAFYRWFQSVDSYFRFAQKHMFNARRKAFFLLVKSSFEWYFSEQIWAKKESRSGKGNRKSWRIGADGGCGGGKRRRGRWWPGALLHLTHGLSPNW